ncbi:MAG: hypothetical protein NHG36_07705 [Chromatiaceae bacterium]|jgi:alcohol dehydrogenase class IV|nr:hypothetical protein [Candidatus Thioaporhodococcus sediminis]
MNSLFLTPATQVLNLMLPSLLSLIPDDIMERGVDALLDVIETAIANSATPVDDALVLPLISALRHKLNVADGAA